MCVCVISYISCNGYWVALISRNHVELLKQNWFTPEHICVSPPQCCSVLLCTCAQHMWRKMLRNVLYVTVCLWFETGSCWHPGSCPLSVLGVIQLIARLKIGINLEHAIYQYHLKTSELHPETVLAGCGEPSSATYGCIPRGFFRSSLREDQKRFANMVANTPNSNCLKSPSRPVMVFNVACQLPQLSRCLRSLCTVIYSATGVENPHRFCKSWLLFVIVAAKSFNR